jgi:uncharacterized protein
MRQDTVGLRLAASDLANHLACRHLTELERAAAEGRLPRPVYHDPRLDILRDRGITHEAAYVASLRAAGRAVVAPDDADGKLSTEQTVDAMHAGTDAIVQARLARDGWIGYVDVLLRAERPSELGNWSYDIADTKLAQNTRAGTVLQLCLYADLLVDFQGTLPERLIVVKPGDGFPAEIFRAADFMAYYRFVKCRLEAVIDAGPSDSTYPDPVEHCMVCRWWKHCDERRRDDDDLSLVAGLASLHRQELNRQGVGTLAQFAEAETPLAERPERGSAETFERLHVQAQVQHQGRREERRVYRFRQPEPERGFLRLPAPSVGDIFFDIEADHFAEGGGIEYLLGFVYRDDDLTWRYDALWALDRDGEKRSYTQFIDFVMARYRRFPDMHVYHYAPYEPAALKRLMGRHATREGDVDRLLRGQRLVDLHAVTRQGLWASVERYSLKDVEKFCGFTRDIDLREATSARRRVECSLELGVAGEILPADRLMVEGYNRDDCLATLALRDWLEERRAELEVSGHAIARPVAPEDEPGAAIEEREVRVRALFELLTAGLPENRDAWSETDRGRCLLAHELEYYRREDRCAWWEFFRLLEMEDNELADERKAIVGMDFLEALGGTARCPIHRYRFPAQEASIGVGTSMHRVGGDEPGVAVGTVVAVDSIAGTIDLKKRAAAAQAHPAAIIALERVPPAPLDGSLLQLAESCREHGLDGDGPYRAARDLLLKRPPRLADDAPALRAAGESALDAAVRLVRTLDRSVLAIQGPPGTGKTYTGARMIVTLAQEGQRVGVTAVSHKVIRNLLDECRKAADEMGVAVRLAHKVKEVSEDAVGDVEEIADNDAAIGALDEGVVVGGTAWLWARDAAIGSLDYLFVDEAGQMALATVLVAGRAAHNIVLLGDPQQLEQPQRGAHPEGAEITALQHLLDGHETMPADRGLFLEETWRMHPRICAFTSEMYYENRLGPHRELTRQALVGGTPFAGSGLHVVPVVHERNQNRSMEEVEAIVSIVERLLRGDVGWIDRDGNRHDLGRDDILIVAPYNAQVGALAERLDGARVGTVDKFQGQQAPVVIYSMTSSSAEDAPRGMNFLYDPHRMNVATSRAKAACILVASPRLFEPECRTPEQMRRANGLCRFRELANVVEPVE